MRAAAVLLGEHRALGHPERQSRRCLSVIRTEEGQVARQRIFSIVPHCEVTLPSQTRNQALSFQKRILCFEMASLIKHDFHASGTLPEFSNSFSPCSSSFLHCIFSLQIFRQLKSSPSILNASHFLTSLFISLSFLHSFESLVLPPRITKLNTILLTYSNQVSICFYLKTLLSTHVATSLSSSLYKTEMQALRIIEL